jgi:hypothetical protein
MYVQAHEFDCEIGMSAVSDFKQQVREYAITILEALCQKENIDKTKIPDITIDNMFDRNTRKLSISDNVAQLNYLINNIDEVFNHITELNPLFLVDARYKQFSIDIDRDSRFPDKFHAVIGNCVDPRVCYEVTIQWVDTSTVKEN